MNIYIVSGEQSADLYGANLAKELFLQNKDIKIRAFGGDKMKKEGVELTKHIDELSFMGFTEVLKNLRNISKNLSFCKRDILKFRPKVLILIDFPGFNLKIAKFAKQQGIKVVYYISPKIWAWNKSRIHKIKKYVDELIVIFPFEVDFYKSYQIEARYFGNPLSDVLKSSIPTISRDKKIVSLLPGSRKQEVLKNLPLMIQIVKYFPEYHFIIASTKEMKSICEKISDKKYNIEILVDSTYSVLKSSEISIVTSGTATLETALLGVPQVVCYKTDFLTYNLARLFIKLKWISLVNILMNKEVVKELIQYDYNISNLEKEIKSLSEESRRYEIQSDYKELKSILNSERTSKKVADFILKLP